MTKWRQGHLITLQIDVIGDLLRDITISKFSTVEQLKQHIFEQIGIEPSDQRLICRGNLLDTNGSLDALNINNGCKINLVKRRKYGESSSSQISLEKELFPSGNGGSVIGEFPTENAQISNQTAFGDILAQMIEQVVNDLNTDPQTDEEESDGLNESNLETNLETNPNLRSTLSQSTRIIELDDSMHLNTNQSNTLSDTISNFNQFDDFQPEQITSNFNDFFSHASITLKAMTENLNNNIIPTLNLNQSAQLSQNPRKKLQKILQQFHLLLHGLSLPIAQLQSIRDTETLEFHEQLLLLGELTLQLTTFSSDLSKILLNQRLT